MRTTAFIDDPKKKKTNPIIQYDANTKKVSPIMKALERNEFQYVITKNDREHVRGDKLCVEIQGIYFYADIDDAILVNTRTKEIRVYHPEELDPPEKREYLILMVYNDDLEEAGVQNTYQGMVGRQETFDFIIQYAGMLDFDKSMILAETTKMKDMISIYKFMKMCIDQEAVENPTGFDPDDYGSEITTEE